MNGFKWLGSKTKSNDPNEYSIWKSKHNGFYRLTKGKSLNNKTFNSKPGEILLESSDYRIIQKAFDEI